MAERTCTIEGCERPHYGRGLCNTHYCRWRKNGSASFRNEGTCEGCGIRIQRPGRRGPIPRKCEECQRVDRAKYNKGAWVRARGDLTCEICSAPTVNSRFCSPSCRTIAYRFPDRPKSVPCSRCGAEVDLTKRGDLGRLPPSNTRLCAGCRPKMRYYGLSAAQLAERDGPRCALCGEDVDFSLRSPHPMSASVDHIIPRSRGGTHDADNLQLAHRTCNTRKGVRTLIPSPVGPGR